MKRIGILGCTGSIGRSTLRVIDGDSNLKVSLLVNNSDLSGLKSLIKKYRPDFAICLSANYFYRNGEECGLPEDILSLCEIYGTCDIVVNGIVGLAGLLPSIAVMQSGKILATANKESFVCAGKLINEAKEAYNAKIYPLDSEHSALWQLIEGRKDIKNLIITASGGAFRDKTKEELNKAKAADALKHPNWIMGKKVTIDCATLMNKGMEIIEAKHLFGKKPLVVGHKESYVHALVQYNDGSYNANISYPDMITPISHALHYPDVRKTSAEELTLDGKTFNFFTLDENRFPCFALAKKAADAGDKAGCVMNAANEVLVERYLADEIGFYDISDGVKKALDKFSSDGDFADISEVFSMSKAVKEYTLSMCFGGNV